ncbi:hypothetical protein A2U01_0103620, partial [Trifolium medium]|nr:hypothetical protein [Trifolium medium]
MVSSCGTNYDLIMTVRTNAQIAEALATMADIMARDHQP